jgi:hypothetical protein
MSTAAVAPVAVVPARGGPTLLASISLLVHYGRYDMWYYFFGLFIALHGLVHLWYVTLSARLVAFQPAMGWSGRSWIFTNLLGDAMTRTLASGLYVLATIGLVVSGIGVMLHSDWWRPVLIGSALFSSAIILLFWDGSMQLVVNKGLLGLLINVMILIALTRLQPAAAGV